MNKKKFFTGLVFCVLLAAVYVVADFTLRTESGDLILDPTSGLVEVNGSLDTKDNDIMVGDGDLKLTDPSYGSDITIAGTSAGTNKPALAINVKPANASAHEAAVRLFRTGDVKDYAEFLIMEPNTGTVNFRFRSYESGAGASYFDINNNTIQGSGDILPEYDMSSDLGSPSLTWEKIYYNGSLMTSSVGYAVPEGKTAVEIVSDIMTGEDGQIDHNSVDESLLIREIDYSQEYYRQLQAIEEELASLGEESGLTSDDIAVKKGYTAYLNNETQEYELISISGLIIAQQEAIKELRTELCAKDESYGFCE